MKETTINETDNRIPTNLPRLYTYEMRQDDPSKCTSAKMRKFGLARSIPKERINKNSIVLNPVAKICLLQSDSAAALRYGLVVIDCSWAKASDVFKIRFRGQQRKLPSLLAGNPTNYSKMGSLSSLEALAAALYIMGFFEYSKRLLSIYKWGETFLSLNKDPLDEYVLAQSLEEIQEIEASYFGKRPV